MVIGAFFCGFVPKAFTSIFNLRGMLLDAHVSYSSHLYQSILLFCVSVSMFERHLVLFGHAFGVEIGEGFPYEMFVSGACVWNID